ncbi:MAG: tetratricopeptide repeat protein [Thermodesulfobacteriota bacterium]
MGLFALLTGKTPAAIEKKADAFFAAGEYGSAKIEFEKALEKLEKSTVLDAPGRHRLEKKLQSSKESLAAGHQKKAENLIEEGWYEDAIELLRLALDLTRDTHRSAEIEKRLSQIPPAPAKLSSGIFSPETIHDERAVTTSGEQPDVFMEYEVTEEENFIAACNALPDEEREVYQSYGPVFRQGYIALNQGDFDSAVILLARAMEETPAGGYIPLELATAHLNLGNHGAARRLLLDYLSAHPESLKACYLLCEVLWEQKEYGSALEFLHSRPPEIAASFAVRMMMGETLLRAGKPQEAADHFLKMLAMDGYNQLVAQSLAKAYEALGLPHLARDLYADILNSCRGCGNTVDVFIKQRFAETSFTTGDHSSKILELFFSLTREDPANRQHYFNRIGSIYQLQGNEREARRYLSTDLKS